MLRAGDVVGDYTIDRWVGGGGFSQVFAAHDASLDRLVAIKVLHLAEREGVAHRAFLRESKALGALGAHPNVVTVHGNGVTDEGHLYLVMELCEAGSYLARVEREGPLSTDEILRVGVAISGALETAHRAGILHRDLKPANLLISDYGQPQLADFGIAILATTTTRSNPFSAAYAAPEQMAGDAVDARADVYGLAACLFTLASGSPPHEAADGEGIFEFARRVAASPAPELTTVRPECPRDLSETLAQALQSRPDDRPQTAAAFGAQLQAMEEQRRGVSHPLVVELPAPRSSFVAEPDSLDAEEKTQWPETSSNDSTNESAERRKGPPVLAAAAAVILIGLGTWFGISRRSQPAAPADSIDVAVAGEVVVADGTAEPEEPTDTESDPEPVDIVVTEPMAFTSPSGNISCSIAPDGVACHIAEKEWQIERPADCVDGNFGHGIELTTAGPAFSCYETQFWDATADQVPYGSSLDAGEFTCDMAITGVTCLNTAGRGFTLRRAAAEFLTARASARQTMPTTSEKASLSDGADGAEAVLVAIDVVVTEPTTFASPSGNISCSISPDGAACHIANKDWEAERPADCVDRDFGNAVELSADGPSFSCYDTGFWDATADPVAYGSALEAGDFRCAMELTGVTCTNDDGRGFALNRAAAEFLETAAPATPPTSRG